MITGWKILPSIVCKTKFTKTTIKGFGPVSLEIPNQGEIPNAGFETSLNPNYPNPFNPETTIEFSIEQDKIGTLEIYNLKGQMIHSQKFQSGDHSYVWNASEQASGMYFYKVSSGKFQQTRKMILMK